MIIHRKQTLCYYKNHIYAAECPTCVCERQMHSGIQLTTRILWMTCRVASRATSSGRKPCSCMVSPPASVTRVHPVNDRDLLASRTECCDNWLSHVGDQACANLSSRLYHLHLLPGHPHRGLSRLSSVTTVSCWDIISD
jgi:hypothetical protein